MPIILLLRTGEPYVVTPIIRDSGRVPTDGGLRQAPEWRRGRLGGVVCERIVTNADGLRYVLVIRRRGIPDRIAGGLAPLLVPAELAVFALHRVRRRGYHVEIRRHPSGMPGGSWRRFRPLPAEQTVIVGPFATTDDGVTEANAIASLVSVGHYPDAP